MTAQGLHMDASYIDDQPPVFPTPPPRYRIDALSGRGGAGTVYRAFDRELGRAVALKFVRDDRPRHRARMLREARAQARVDHPNVCAVFDVIEDGERLFIAMQWIAGERLDTIAPSLSLEEKIRLLRDVADAVHAAHVEGIIHRDLKPANILVERRDDGALHPYVVDFGLARALDEPDTTATGDVIGTPHYLAPEQAWGLPVDRRSDVYSLGATLFELLAGTPPFRGDTGTDVMMQVITRPAPPLHRVVRSVPRDLSVIVERCLEKERERRYDSARAFADDLTRWLRGEPIAARAPGVGYRAWSLLRRHRAVAASIAVATIVTGSVAGYRITQLQQDRAQRDAAATLEDRVKYIEHLVDHDRALPLHDTRPEIQRASLEINRLNDAETARRFPAVAAYAEGRARLAIADIRSARTLLARAWAEGFRSPETAYSFAVALTDDYVRSLTAAGRIQDNDLRSARIAETEREYRDAVAPLLTEARRSVEQPSMLIEARLAFAAGDNIRTTTLTKSVVSRFPWSNEARLLEAAAHIREAGARRRAGDARGADASFDLARRAFLEAAITAPSDVRIHDGLCQIAVDEMQIDGPFSTQLHANDGARFAAARTACEQTLVADPAHVSAMVALSSAWSLRAFQRQHEGDSGAAETASAWDNVRRALVLAPDNPAALIQAGLTQWRMGLGHGAIAAQFLRRAVAADPRSPDARHALGRSLLLQNDELMSRGSDPRPVLAEAVAQYREAIRLAPNFTGAYNNLGIALTHRGRYAMRTGLDPEPFLREAIAVLDPAIAKSPLLAEPQSVCAAAWALIAEARASRKLDVTAEIRHAAQRYDEAIRLNPTYLGDYNSRAELRLFEARIAQDPERREQSLNLADADMKFMESATPGSAALVRAEWYRLKALHASDTPMALVYIDRADKGIARFAAALPYKDASAWLARGQLARLRCKVSAATCNASLAESYFRRALAIAPNRGADVERLRGE